MKYKACQKCANSVGPVNIIGNIFMIVLKGYMGVIGGSKGLIADAIHSCADLLATIIMIIGLNISKRKKNDSHPYGYGKIEYIVAIVIYLFLIVIAGYILYDGIKALIEGRAVVPCMVAAWGAIFSITINELMFRQAVCAGNQINSPSMIAKAWESRSDVYSSIAVVIGIIGAKLGFHFMDPLAAVVVGLIILKICVEMIKDASSNLMDKAPENINIHDLKNRLLNKLNDIAIEIKSMKVREIGSELECNVDINIPDCISVKDGEEIRKEICEILSGMLERKSNIFVRLYPFEEETI